jgi:hypothetical protein
MDSQILVHPALRPGRQLRFHGGIAVQVRGQRELTQIASEIRQAAGIRVTTGDISEWRRGSPPSCGREHSRI